MNRIISRKRVATVYALEVHRKGLSVDAVTGVSASNCQEHTEKLDAVNIVHQYDIAIVGGGMVGMALACALSRKPLTKHLNVAIIDNNPALEKGKNIKKGAVPDPRVSTVTPATISFFKDVGAWDYVQQHRHTYFDKMQVWDYTGLGYTRYTASDICKDILGCVVENKVLHSSLLSSLLNGDFQKTIYPARLTSMDIGSHTPSKEVENKSGSLAKLDLSDGNSIYAKLVVGADGGKSRVRELAALKTTGWKYSQNAIICTVEHTVENKCAWQRFLPTGPIALLPIGDNFSNIVWTMNPKESSDRKIMVEDEFVKAINHALDYGYGPHPQPSFFGYNRNSSWELPPKVMKVVTERMVFPLSLMYANDYVANRVALVGDAAHIVHPLAGQGVNLGIADALALVKVIADGIAVGSDIGDLGLLKRYEAERKPANIIMTAILDSIQKGYSVDLGPLNLLRAAAFHATEHIFPLKRNIISYATGEQKWPLFSEFN